MSAAYGGFGEFMLPPPEQRRWRLTDDEQGAMGWWSPEQCARFDELVAWGQSLGQTEAEAICSAFGFMQGLYAGEPRTTRPQAKLYPTRIGGRSWRRLCGFCGRDAHEGPCRGAGVAA